MKPQRIFLIRHVESITNIDRKHHKTLSGHKILLTEKGMKQAVECGKKLLDKIISEKIFFYLSPYLRTKQTLNNILSQLGKVKYQVREKPTIRVQGYGNPRDQFIDFTQDPGYKKMGSFFYHFPNGKCGANVYDRVSSFFYTLHRDFNKPDYPENVVIITHGMLMRLFLMRWYHWFVDKFKKLANPHNCYICTINLNSSKYILEEPFTKNK